ncbi:hypothetical protein [Abyssalbus ytuae]|uniref:Chromosome partitioning protein ParA n=1 Tax=Abyssalbus ytuae TaxID=2926907 RepID=A0A9E6ZRB3_9FLAO|nr:hypothetical protein [Abyssalbus ytuae]UOB19125.1 hypothetical protein MQE35_07465 [Abyssalbus ytuae]
MNGQKNKSGQKIVLGALILSILALIAISYYNYSESEEKIAFLKSEKAMLIEDLTNIRADFDELSKNNEANIKEIEVNKEKINGLIDSIQTLDVDYNTLRRYRREMAAIRKENQQLRKVVDSITQENLSLYREIDSTNLKIVELTALSDTLLLNNKKLLEENEKLKGDALTLADLNGSTYKVRSNGKVSSTNRANRTERIRACFTVVPLRINRETQKDFFIQFLDPDNKMLGDVEKVKVGDSQIEYSKRTVVFVDNKPLSVCDYIVTNKDLLKPGKYTINVYDDVKLITTTTFELK